MEGVIQDDPVEPQGIGATVSRIPPLDPRKFQEFLRENLT